MDILSYQLTSGVLIVFIAIKYIRLFSLIFSHRVDSSKQTELTITERDIQCDKAVFHSCIRKAKEMDRSEDLFKKGLLKQQIIDDLISAGDCKGLTPPKESNVIPLNLRVG
jgi:hypothetical protein